MVGFVVVTALVVVSARAIVRPWFGAYSRLNIPYAALVDAVTEAEGGRPALVLTNDKQIAGNIRTLIAEAAVAMPRLSNPLPIDLSKRPLLAVWHDDANPAPPMPDLLKDALKASGVPEAAITPRNLALPYLYGSGSDRYAFSYVWVSK
jgi:hypothetical protein